MYVLLSNSRILLGVFSSKEMLNIAIKAIKIENPECFRLYYQKIEVDKFDSTLMNFFTIHPEKFVELNVKNEKEIYV